MTPDSRSAMNSPGVMAGVPKLQHKKPGVASQNNPSSPQHTSCLLSPLMRVLGLMHFLQGPKNSAKTESQSAACVGEHQHWAQDTQPGCHRSRGWPQGTTLCIHHFPLLNYHSGQHCILSYFQFNQFLLPDKPQIRVQTHPPALQRQQQLMGTWNNQGN